MNKQTLINKINEILKEIEKTPYKFKQYAELCRDLKVNTGYNGRVYIRVKKNITYKELEALVDILTVVV